MRLFFYFYQILLPFCDPKMLVIKGDPCQPVYINVSNLSNHYELIKKQFTAVKYVILKGIVFWNKADCIHNS